MRVRALRILDLSDRRTCLQSDFAPLGCKQCALGYRRSTNRLEGTVLRGLLVVSHLPTSSRWGGVGGVHLGYSWSGRARVARPPDVPPPAATQRRHCRYSPTRREDRTLSTAGAGARLPLGCTSHSRPSGRSRIGEPSRTVTSLWSGGSSRKRSSCRPVSIRSCGRPHDGPLLP